MSKTSVEQLYGDFWADEDRNPVASPPRGTEWLFDVFAELGPQAGQLVVDVGARDAKHAVRLVQQHSLRGIAVDPVTHNVELDMPIDDGVADWIWCRDVLVHVDLARGFAECARVLRPEGHMLAYVTCSTERLEPREAAWLFDALAIVPESTDPQVIETRAADAGLTLRSKTELGGEWRERMLDDGTWSANDDLAELSRLRRSGADFDDPRVAAQAAGAAWGIYQLLGKTCPTVYVWASST